MFKFQAIGFTNSSRILLVIALFVGLSNKVQAQSEHPLQREVEDAILFLQDKPEEDVRYIRFFTTYAVKPELREKCALSLSFVLHSLVGAPNGAQVSAGYYPIAKMEDITIPATEEGAEPTIQQKFVAYRLVPGSETLWWIDIRDYNWSEEAWESISSTDGYVVEPIVDHRTNSYLRLIAGNVLVRADWFVSHATDTTMQSDKDVPVDFYRTLIYGTPPTNITEVWNAWGFDMQHFKQFTNEAATLVTNSQNVARHNRTLFYYRTGLGYLYETFDVKKQIGLRDYVEAFPVNAGRQPSISDAGEMFWSNTVQMQTYDLRDGQGNLVDFADPTVARHINDTIGDVRVRTAHSCMDCHAGGPLPAENTIREYLQKAKLYIPDKEDQLRVDRVFLSGRFEESIEDSQLIFERAMEKINGLKPQENLKYYLEVTDEYKRPVSLETAAFECGLTVEEFTQKLKEGLDVPGKVPGRLAILLTLGDKIPRETWETPGEDGIPGMFQQSMIYMYGLTKIETTISEEITTETETDVVLNTVEYYNEDLVIASEGKLTTSIRYQNGERLESGDTVQIIDREASKGHSQVDFDQYPEKIMVLYNNKLYFVQESQIKRIDE